MNYQDQTLKCKDCSKEFVFTVREQEYYAEKGFSNPPSRCKDCRIRKKAVDSTQQNREVFIIKCKNCGKTGEMTIKPHEPEDVLCSECFMANFKEQLAKQKS